LALTVPRWPTISLAIPAAIFAAAVVCGGVRPPCPQSRTQIDGRINGQHQIGQEGHAQDRAPN
jgi:hypothetical protein